VAQGSVAVSLPAGTACFLEGIGLVSTESE